MEILATNEDGLTVGDLRKALSRVLDVNEDGTYPCFYVAVGNLQTSTLKTVAIDDDGDIVLIPEFWQNVMEDIETWDEFIE